MPGVDAMVSHATAHGPQASRHSLPIEEGARQATRMLGLLGDQRRLLLLCPLAEGALCAEDLALALGVPEVAIPRLFASLCEEGLVSAERDGWKMLYRLAAPETARVMRLLRDLYCTPEA